MVPVSIFGIGIQKALETLLSQSTFLQNGIFILGVLGVKWTVATYVFHCPCQDGDFSPGQTTVRSVTIRQVYVATFFVWPAVVFSLIVILSSRRCRRWLTGARYRGCCTHSQFCWSVCPPALVTSASWVFFLLLDGRYYQCAASQPPLGCVDFSNTSWRYAEVRSQSDYHHAMSQLLAWCFLGLIGILAASVLTCSRAFARTPYYQQRWMEARYEEEEESFVRVSQNLLMKSTDTAWRKFLTEKKENELRDWCRVSAISETMPVLVGSQYAYSSLDLWYQNTTQVQNEVSSQSSLTPKLLENQYENRSFSNSQFEMSRLAVTENREKLATGHTSVVHK